MSEPQPDANADILGRLQGTILERLGSGLGEQAAAFASCYYARETAEELEECDLPDLYGAALAHWRGGRLACL